MKIRYYFIIFVLLLSACSGAKNLENEALALVNELDIYYKNGKVDEFLKLLTDDYQSVAYTISRTVGNNLYTITKPTVSNKQQEEKFMREKLKPGDRPKDIVVKYASAHYDVKFNTVVVKRDVLYVSEKTVVPMFEIYQFKRYGGKLKLQKYITYSN